MIDNRGRPPIGRAMLEESSDENNLYDEGNVLDMMEHQENSQGDTSSTRLEESKDPPLRFSSQPRGSTTQH